MQADLRRRAVGDFELIGGVDLGIDLDGFDRRPLEPQRLRAIPTLTAHALHLQAARDGVRVLLQGDDTLHRRGGRVDQHDAAFEEFGGVGEGGHGFINPLLQMGRGMIKDISCSFHCSSALSTSLKSTMLNECACCASHCATILHSRSITAIAAEFSATLRPGK